MWLGWLALYTGHRFRSTQRFPTHTHCRQRAAPPPRLNLVPAKRSNSWYCPVALGILLLTAPIGPSVAPLRAAAQQSAPSHATIELIADRGASSSTHHLDLGLLFHLDPGWHIYWQNPGDSGEPPKIDWRLPPGFRAGAIEWPSPKHLGSGSIIDYGYEDRVLLMTPITPPAAVAKLTAPVQFIADVEYIVCREICVPGKQHLALSLPDIDAAQARQWRHLFTIAQSELPKPVPPQWRISATSAGADFVVTIAGVDPPKTATFFPEDPGIIDNSAPQVLASASHGFRLTLKKSDQLSLQPIRLRGVLAMEGTGAYQIAVPVSARSSPDK